MSARLHQVADIVLAIERAMRDGGYWHDTPPSPAAMASRVPFCADTLTFAQWLQYLFLPRMRVLIETGGPLPETSGIGVMAVETLDDGPGREALLHAIRRFDALIEHG